MPFNVKKNAIFLLDFIHSKIFGHAMGVEMKKFLANLGITAISIVFSGVVMLLVNIFAGRFMGPEEYGKYQLVYSIANIFIIFALLGINISVARINFAQEKEKNEKLKIIGTSFWFVTLNSLVLSLLFYYFRNFFERFNISETVIIFSIILSIGLVYYNLIRGYFQAEHKFGFIAKSEIINYLVVIISFLVLIFLGGKEFKYIVYPLALGCLAFSLVGIYKIKSYLFGFEYTALKKLIEYGFLSFLITTSGLIISSFNRIILNYFLGERDLGVYAAYFLSSTILVMFIVRVFSLVFFPTVAKVENAQQLKSISNKIIVLEKYFIIPIIMVNLIVIYIFIRLYGSKFDLNFKYLLLVSISSSLSLFTYLRHWFLIGTGKKGVRVSLKIVCIVAIMSLIYYVILTNFFGLLGAFISLFLVNLTYFFLNNLYINNMSFSNKAVAWQKSY